MNYTRLIYRSSVVLYGACPARQGRHYSHLRQTSASSVCAAGSVLTGGQYGLPARQWPPPAMNCHCRPPACRARADQNHSNQSTDRSHPQFAASNRAGRPAGSSEDIHGTFVHNSHRFNSRLSSRYFTCSEGTF